MQLGLELGRLGQKGESFQEYAEALRLAEMISINKITPEVRQTLLTQCSACLIIEQRLTEVIEVLTGVLAKNGPLTVGHLMVRARTDIHLKQPVEALNDAELAHSYKMNGILLPSAINPQSLALEAMMAEVLFINQRYPEALEYFETALKSDNPEPRTVLGYSECLNKIGKTGKVIQYIYNIAINNNSIPNIWIRGAAMLMRHEGLRTLNLQWIADAQQYYSKFSEHLADNGTLEKSETY
jgi:predicted Zn-dependent protease